MDMEEGIREKWRTKEEKVWTGRASEEAFSDGNKCEGKMCGHAADRLGTRLSLEIR
jgi:hypothetical protein